VLDALLVLAETYPDFAVYLSVWDRLLADPDENTFAFAYEELQGVVEGRDARRLPRPDRLQVRSELVRRLPGRLVGQAFDGQGRPPSAFSSRQRAVAQRSAVQ